MFSHESQDVRMAHSSKFIQFQSIISSLRPVCHAKTVVMDVHFVSLCGCGEPHNKQQKQHFEIFWICSNAHANLGVIGWQLKVKPLSLLVCKVLLWSFVVVYNYGYNLNMHNNIIYIYIGVFLRILSFSVWCQALWPSVWIDGWRTPWMLMSHGGQHKSLERKPTVQGGAKLSLSQAQFLHKYSNSNEW